MKQITEPAPLVTLKRPDIPEDLALAISRCLEKDPENRWPTADSLRRALETRTVTGYRPHGSARLARPAASAGRRSRRAPGPGEPVGSAAPPAIGPPARPPERGAWPVRARAGRGLAGPFATAPRAGRDRKRTSRHRHRRAQDRAAEPRNSLRVGRRIGRVLPDRRRHRGTSVVPLLLGGMGIPLLRSYATLWQSGYSWRDVLSRPPAPETLESSLGRASLPRRCRPDRGRVRRCQSDPAAPSRPRGDLG